MLKLDLTPDDARAHFCEPCVPGFEHVLEVADDATAQIMRHLRHERRINKEGPK